MKKIIPLLLFLCPMLSLAQSSPHFLVKGRVVVPDSVKLSYYSVQVASADTSVKPVVGSFVEEYFELPCLFERPAVIPDRGHPNRPAVTAAFPTRSASPAPGYLPKKYNPLSERSPFIYLPDNHLPNGPRRRISKNGDRVPEKPKWAVTFHGRRAFNDKTKITTKKSKHEKGIVHFGGRRPTKNKAAAR